VPTVELFAVQAYVTQADYESADAFARKTTALFDRIDALRERGPDGKPRHPGLAVFPEMYGTFTCIAGFADAVRGCETVDAALGKVAMRALPSLLFTMATRLMRPAVAFLFSRAPSVHAIWAGTFQRLARERGLAVVAGSALLPEGRVEGGRFLPQGRRVYNVSYAFGPDGAFLGRTRKVNLVPTQEDVLGLSPGPESDLAPFDTGFGKVGTLICYDGFNEAHTRAEPGFCVAAPVQAGRGAVILAQPSANGWPWEDRWIFAEEGETQLRKDQWLKEGLFGQLGRLSGVRYAVNALLIGQIFDNRFDGRSYIFERTPSGEARIAAEARRADLARESEEIVVHRGEI
jgi:predicted amidohydrolase